MHTKRAAKKSGKLRKLRRGFILLVLLIAIVVLVIYTLNSVGPVIVSVSEARIRALTTSAVNSAIFEVMTEPTKYSELITIQKDDAGNITLIEANAIVINNLAREMAKQTETYMEAIGEQVIKIPVGTLSGSPLLSGKGPKVTVKVVPVGSVKCHYLQFGRKHNMEAFYGILIPFLGTSLGAACVFFMRKTLSDTVQRALTGFAAGVMVAASIWSLLIPAIEQSAAMGTFAFFPALLGFWLGVLFLLALDHLIPHLHVGSEQAEGPKSRLARTTMMVLAVTLHNIPEGMAVGVMYAGFLAGSTQITAASALALSIGIAIQNFPEGAIISMPLRAEGQRKGNAFLGGVLSGVVEPIGAVLTIIATQFIVPALPYLLSFAAGAMLYVVVEELIPEMSQGRHSNIGTVFFAVGFSVMMVLDVALG